MKFFIVFAAALAAVSAGYIAPVAPVVYGAQHLPVIGPNGVPVDTAEVQHARAAHLVHKAEAHARNGDFAVVAHAAPLAYAHHAVAAPVVAAHSAHGLVAHVGVAETPEVVAAKHAHFAAHAEALARVAPVHHLYRRGIYAAAPAVAAYTAPIAYAAQHLPVIGPNGVPVDTAEVQHARAAHFAHKADAHARNGDFAVVGHHAIAASVVAHAAPLAYAHHAVAAPVVAAHSAHGLVAHVGVAETPEVVAAKHAHFVAHAEALARVAPIHHLHRRGIYAAAPAVAAYTAPIAYAAQHLPVIGPNGVPVDTAEVQHARAAHLAHKAEAYARNGDYLTHPVVAAAYGVHAHAYGAHHLGSARYL